MNINHAVLYSLFYLHKSMHKKGLSEKIFVPTTPFYNEKVHSYNAPPYIFSKS